MTETQSTEKLEKREFQVCAGTCGDKKELKVKEGRKNSTQSNAQMPVLSLLDIIWPVAFNKIYHFLLFGISFSLVSGAFSDPPPTVAPILLTLPSWVLIFSTSKYMWTSCFF